MTEVIYGTTKDGLQAARVDTNTYCLKVGRNGPFISENYTSNRDIPEMTESDFFGHLGNVADFDAFKAEMEDIANHIAQRKALGRKSIGSSTSTPWGKSQGATVYAEGGLFKHHTAGHGGMKVYSKLNKLIPEPYRNDDGWYEEDCEMGKVMVSLPQFFTDREIRQATKTVINYYPDEYEKVTGIKLQPGQSQKRDERVFKAAHAQDWVVISAVGFTDEDGLERVRATASLGGEYSRYERGQQIDVETKTFVVPRDEYQTRSKFGFVIDESRHPEFVETPKEELREASEEELNHLFGKKP